MPLEAKALVDLRIDPELGAVPELTPANKVTSVVSRPWFGSRLFVPL